MCRRTQKGHVGLAERFLVQTETSRERVLLLLGILLFLNYGVARLSDLLAYQMWPRDVDMAVFIVFGSAVLYVVIALMLMAMLGVGGIVLVYLCTVQ